MNTPLRLRRGEIRWADLDPARGTEPGKLRPVLIVQCQALLDAGHPSTYIVPLTTQLEDDAEPLRIRVPAIPKLRASDLLLDQARAIDNRRLTGKPIARLSEKLMDRIAEALAELLGLGETAPGSFPFR